MELGRIIFLALFASIIIVVLFLLSYFPSISIGEEIPGFEEIVNSTVSYNISANLEMEIKVNFGRGLAYISYSLENCSFLYMTNNISALKCPDYYIKKDENLTISCMTYKNEWSCEENLISPSNYFNTDIFDFNEAFLNSILKETNYTVIGKSINVLDGRLAYCYNITFYRAMEREEYNVTGNVTFCFDKQTKILTLIESKTIQEEFGELYFKYRLKNLVVNPRYEDIKDILKPPAKVKIYAGRFYIKVDSNSLNISTYGDYKSLNISEKIEKVVVFYLNNNYTVENCNKEGSYIVCPINKTIEEFIIEHRPSIEIVTENYIYSISPYYIFGEVRGLIRIEGFSYTDGYSRYLVICYDKDWDAENKACRGYGSAWRGDYVEIVSSPFSRLIKVNDTVKRMTIVISSVQGYDWTIKVYKEDKLIKTCYNITRETPCIVYFS